jgi:hypothetical protein
VATGEVVGSNPFEWVGFAVVPGGHYRCELLAASATGGLSILAMYDADGRYNLMRRVDGNADWVFDVDVRGGYAAQTVLTSDWDGLAWTSVWPKEGRKTATVEVRLRRPAGFKIAEAGCSYTDRRADGVTAVPIPYQVVAHGDRVTLVLDKWRVAQCLYVIVPSSARLPETATAPEPASEPAGPGTGGPPAWWMPGLVAALLVARLVSRRAATLPGAQPTDR